MCIVVDEVESAMGSVLIGDAEGPVEGAAIVPGEVISEEVSHLEVAEGATTISDVVFFRPFILDTEEVFRFPEVVIVPGGIETVVAVTEDSA